MAPVRSWATAPQDRTQGGGQVLRGARKEVTAKGQGVSLCGDKKSGEGA